MDQDFWNERYSEPGFMYGTEPNEFLVEAAHHIPPGPVLSLGEGEGRNAIYLARLGYDVTAVDQSDVGLAKLERRAGELGLAIHTRQVDLADYKFEPAAWAGIVSIFCHLPPAIRGPLYADLKQGLRPGGVFILESYTPDQCGRGTGGPPDPAMMLTLAELHRDLAGLEFLHARELEREVREGAYHSGLAAVVQVVARRGG
jgi:SAM-dependent methyltransferase